jgi:hypothetical protein
MAAKIEIKKSNTTASIPRASRRSRTNRDSRNVFQLMRTRFQGGTSGQNVVD